MRFCKGKEERYPLEYISGAEIVFSCKNSKRNKSFVELVIYDGYTRAYVKAINFKKFYKGLYDFLDSQGFIDIWEFGRPVDSVELPDKSETRSHDMYETSFLYADRGDGKEYDIWWKMKKEISDFGTFYLEFNIVNRFFLEKNGLQDGKWEIMVNARYESTIGDGIKKTILAKYFDWLADWEHLAYKHIYRNVIERDVNDVLKLIDDIWEEIGKYLA